MAALFPAGSIVATPGALDALIQADVDPLAILARHVSGDWGDVSADDAAESEISVKHGYRILSSYGLNTGQRVWIITEHDRSLTTLLLPAEY